MSIRGPRLHPVWEVLRALAVAFGAVVAGAVTITCRADWQTVVANGSPANRVDIVFLGDGYTQANLNAGLYNAHIQNYLGHMFAAPSYLADPFPRYQKFFNVHRINVVSQQSGADDPLPNGIFLNTALNASYDIAGIDRLLGINDALAEPVVASFQAGTGIEPDIRIVTVNSTQYGGSGGRYSVFAGGNNDAREIALHELSHSFSATADEYVSFHEPYAGPEPDAVNATINPTGAKWSLWHDFRDPRGASLDIGAFQGGNYYASGVYRPSFDSKMNNLGVPFNAVVREQTILDIYAKVDPLDAWLSDDATVDAGQLWVDVVDPNVIAVDWFVNNQKVATNYGESFDLADFVTSAGTYVVQANAYDRILNHVGDGTLLDLVRIGLDALQQSVAWTVDFVPHLPGDYNSDGVVDTLDYSVWKANFGSGSNLVADGNDDGIVDSADYSVWRDNLGRRSLTLRTGGEFVPEPNSLCLVVLAIVCLQRRYFRPSAPGSAGGFRKRQLQPIL
jgi:hypothetical protein